LFNRKQGQAQDADEDLEADVIDLLLAADEPTRRQLMLRAVESGALSRAEADQLLAQVLRLERVAGPRTSAEQPASEAQPAWGIDYP
jgi:hypothetical protein